MTVSPPPTLDEIAERVFERGRRRGAGHGRETRDWDQAERELRAERGLDVGTKAADT